MWNYNHTEPYLVTYQKPNGEVIFRFLKHMFLDVGQINNSGWKVISIQKYNSEKHKFQEIIPYYSTRISKEKMNENSKKNKKGKLSRIISIIKE